VSCKAKQYATRPPVSTALEFAMLSCGSPLGKGVQHNSADVTSNPERTSGAFRTGDFRGTKGTGTIRGSSTDGLTSTLTEKLTLTLPRSAT
jgi:hypothetical protein